MPTQWIQIHVHTHEGTLFMLDFRCFTPLDNLLTREARAVHLRQEVIKEGLKYSTKLPPNFITTRTATMQHTIGIPGIYTYFPKLYVSQADCEEYDNVGSGKYTIGLGQAEMAIADPQEDIVSMALTACNNLMDQCNLSPMDIGRIEVSTEKVRL